MYDKRKLVLSILIAVIVAVLFWSQSRLPQLNEKAQMGERNTITALAFDTIYPAEISDHYLVRVAKTSVNWGYTNWKGMAFGLLLASILLCVFSYAPRWKPSKNNLINSIKGVITGIPLSVCVNCTTPIAYGMHRSGVNLVTVLSMLMSSPTLNIIVLAISFSLLPWHLATLKVLSSLVFIVIFVPLIVKFVKPDLTNKETSVNKLEGLKQSPTTTDPVDTCVLEPASSNWTNALIQVLKSLAANSIVIIKMTLPLMLIAGILGALVIEALPNAETHTLAFGLGLLLIFALIGTLLPVPIAFDIVAVVSLLALGLPAGYAMALLFSLGIFSIYPALVIAKHISIKLSAVLLGTTVLMAVLVGISGQYLDDYINHKNAETLSWQLKQQRSDDAMQILTDTCYKESTEPFQTSCVTDFLGGEYASIFASESCDRILSVNDSLMNSCRDIILFNQVLTRAKADLDIQHCMSLTNLDYQGKCWLDYAQYRALEPDALEYCSAFSNKKISAQCNENITFYRVARIQNLSACDGLYSHKEKQSCEAHLAAMLTSLEGNINACDSLSDLNQINSCKKNMFLTAIENQSDYQICETLQSSELIEQCKNYSNFDRARKQNNRQYCGEISSVSLKHRCSIAVIHKNVVKQINDPNTIEQKLLLINIDMGKDSVSIETVISSGSAVPVVWQEWYQDQDISIQYWQHKQNSSNGSSTFIKHPASDFGLTHNAQFDLVDFFEPFSYGRGIATGDFNNDFWPDVVVSTSSGPALFINKGDGKFIRQPIANVPPQSSNTLLVALVDLNNDGWQDLFTSQYGGKNQIYWNNKGKFDHQQVLIEEDAHRIATMAAGFADWDKDGDIDYVAGNWSYGTQGAFNPEYSSNHWLVNTGGTFDLHTPNELPGETLSILLSDINQDDYIDLLVANDREYPDHHYNGTKSGFVVKDKKRALPISPLNNMSFESADFNNDLRLDVFAVDMSFSISDHTNYCKGLADNADRKYCEEILKGYQVIENLDVEGCAQLSLNKDRRSCLVALAVHFANQDANPEFCAQIPSDLKSQRRICEILAKKGNKKPNFSAKKFIPQQQQNVLLMGQLDGSLVDMSKAMNATDTMWSWNAKAADLDNDQWQDIYVGNGFEFGTKNNEIHSNVFLHNQGGERFVQSQQEFGLTDYTNTSNYSYVDLDLDGDLDIIAGGSLSMPRVFENQQTTNNSVTFSLRDENGNRFCIGCKVIIHYGDDKSQIRELKLSGGFQSFDDPVVHFGLGQHTSITSVEVTWSTGKKSIINKEFLVNRRYLIRSLTQH